MIKIRQANEADIPAIQQVARDSWHHTYKKLIPERVINQCIEAFYHHDQLTNRINHHTVFVATRDHHVIGFLDGSNNQPDTILYALYLNPDALHKGIGSLLFNAYIRRNQPKTVTVEVEKGNDSAVHFYRKHGFKYDTAFVDEVFGYPLQTERYIWQG
ncbi:MAG: N-acetyltransferase family protein [Bacillota bacterium]